VPNSAIEKRDTGNEIFHRQESMVLSLPVVSAKFFDRATGCHVLLFYRHINGASQ
jgi:hypothetical protein